MQNGLISWRGALLASTLALAALAQAKASASPDDSKLLQAIEGNRASARNGNDSEAKNPPDFAYTTLHNFAGRPNDGAVSTATVALDGDGNIYGTTQDGGGNDYGAIFRLAPNGVQTLLHSFGVDDGASPAGAVLIAPDGNLYGTTNGGGSGNGVLYALMPSGDLQVLHSFNGADGASIRGHLFRDKKGNLYGTALSGGNNNNGTVFKYSHKGVFKVLHYFNGSDGQFPEHGVVGDKAGNLYGVTAFGGTNGYGTVYKIAANGAFSTLHNFTNGADGGFLYGSVDIDAAGNIYGSTVNGGADGYGTVFKISADGTFSTLYSFPGGAAGANPEGDMLVSGKYLYSTTNVGGSGCQCGVIYRLKTNGKGGATVVHSFNGQDGSAYAAGLTKSGNAFYGTTSAGGPNGDGVVFRFTKN